MSDDLSALLRAAALEQEGAARTERPYSVEMLRRYVRDVRRRRAAGGARLLAAGVVVVVGVLYGAARLTPADQLTPVGTATPPSVMPSSTIEPTPTTTATPPPTPTPAPTTEPAATPTLPLPASSAPPPPPTTPPATPLLEAPGAVAGVQTGLGGGSGEVVVTWASTPGATGYRVYRSDVATGPFVLSASFDVATARTTVAFTGSYESIQIWQPDFGDNHDLEYVEVVHWAPGYFRVAAFNAAGEGPMSGVVCGEPFAVPPTGC